MDDLDLPGGYDDPLDSKWIDPDPDFRETLRLLNAAGVHTVNSCQGHAPGTPRLHLQEGMEPYVQEWMEPYVTCQMMSPAGISLARDLLQSIGGGISTASEEGKIVACFPRGWEWRRSVDALKALT